MKHLALIVMFSALAGCQSSQWPLPSSVQPAAAPAERPRAVSVPVVLAEGVVPPADLGRRAWVADEVTLGQQRALTHSHEAAFVYAAVTPSRLTVSGQTRTLRPGEAVFVGDHVAHTHEATCTVPTDCRDSFWEIRLAAPGVPPPTGETARVFVSPPFTVSSTATPTRLRFELLQVPPGAVAPLSGRDIRYFYLPPSRFADTRFAGLEGLRPGTGLLTLPGGTPVDVRNGSRTPVAVLVWHAG
jgi:hypothetical protein